MLLQGMLLFIFSQLRAEEGPTRIYIEAEDCQGLERLAWDNEMLDGWYARISTCRYYGAPGRTCHAAIHENATNRTISQKLNNPVPAGKYKAFLRTLGPRHFEEGKPTSVRVALGGQELVFTWVKGDRKFVWQAEQDVELKQPVAEVSFTALTFGGHGHGAMYETKNRSIWLDTLYLTNDLNEKSPPPVEAETFLRDGLPADAIPPRPAFAADDQETPRAIGKPDLQPIVLNEKEGRKNMWPNSSLELGMNDGWSFGGYGQPYVFTDEDLDKTNPFHGSYSLKVPAKKSPFSRPCYLPEGSDVTLSAYVRGSGPVSLQLIHVEHDSLEPFRGGTIPIKPVLNKTGTAGEAWQRLSISGPLTKGWYYIKCINTDQIWVDALQFEKGNEATPYAPAASIECGLRTGQVGNITYEDQKTLDVWFHNSGDKEESASLKYRIVDVRDQIIAEGKTEAVRIEPGQTLRKPMAIIPPARGIFSVVYAVDGRELPEGETVYVRMPNPPEGETRHQLGANISFNEQELRLKSRLGLKWTLTCKTRVAGAAVEYVHPKPDLWQWADEAVQLPKKFGMSAVTCFWPHRIPPFMKSEANQNFRTVRGGHTFSPELKQWKDYVGRVASHYKDMIGYWCVDDEAELSWAPEQFAPVVNATIEAVKEQAPNVKVGLSGTPEFTEELLKMVDVKEVDFFGGSTFDFPHWESKRVKHLCERYNKTWVCYGVGQRPPTHSMYHTLYTYESPRYKAAWMARQMIYLLLVQDLKIAGHYAGVLRNDGRHYGQNKPLCDYDGTPIPWGATFAVMGTLLADAIPEGDVKLGDTGVLAYLFRNGDQLGAVTWSTAIEEYDHHWKGTRRRFENLRLGSSAASVEVLDMYWNPLPDVQQTTAGIRFLLDEEPVFIMNRGLSREDFIKMLSTVSAPGLPIEITPEVVGSKDGPRLSLTITNRTGAALKNASLDLRSPLNKPVSIGAQWIFPQPIASAGDIDAGKAKTVSLPLHQGPLGIEDGQFRATLRSEDGTEYAMDDWLWLHPADAGKLTIDGNFDEWQSLPNSTIAYDWAWARFGRSTTQIFEGGEYFSYASYSLDARAVFRVAWNDTHLYVQMTLEDDQPILEAANGESIRLVIAGTEIRVRPKDGKGGAAIVTKGTEQELDIHSKVDDKRIRTELAVPWEALKVTARKGDVIGFDLYWTDVDREEEDVVAGTLRWAGGSSKGGYLILR